jgi:CHRD domain
MRGSFAVVAGLVMVAGCTDPAPTEMPGGTRVLAPSLSNGSEGAPIAVFNTQLRAENEPNNASTSASKGHAQVKILADKTVEFTLFVNNKDAEAMTRAHIHRGAVGVNGPIHWDFHEPPDPVVVGDHIMLRGVARPRAAASPDDLLANPAQYYVNVHSQRIPGGFVRGQLP